MKPSVLVGMSGGVDSSVSAALLVKQGYRVIGGFIKNWSDSKDLWTGECQWRGERRDAMRVAAKLGIPLLTFDFEQAYKSKIVEDLFRGYAAGETPNPDVLCNELIKFGLFLEEAKKLGVDYVATGHYARVECETLNVKRETPNFDASRFMLHVSPSVKLLRGVDPEKDQSYFLYRVPQEALAMTLFPVGDLEKNDVRRLAQEFDLPVAAKPDSQGICFVGKLDMGEFLRKKIAPRPGDIIGPDGNVLGRHEGLDQYTIGQRQKIGVSKGGSAWYVARKDRERNQLVVVPDADHPLLYSTHMTVDDLHWTRGVAPSFPCRVEVQVRYRQPAIPAMLETLPEGGLIARFDVPVKAIAPGQSAVFYQRDECLGGGVIAEQSRESGSWNVESGNETAKV